MKVLHVFNYAWPYLDGYTARSIGLITAQRRYLKVGGAPVEVAVAVSPFPPLAHGTDEAFETSDWNADLQIKAARFVGGKPVGARGWERPAMGLAPATTAEFEAELESMVRRTGADLIHAHHPHYNAGPALRVAQKIGLPGIYELRCFNGDYDLDAGGGYATARGRWQNRLELELAREASVAVTIADGLAERMRRGGVDPARLFVVRNSVDTVRFTPAGASSDSEKSLGRRLRVGYATTFEVMENLEAAVTAAGAVAADFAGQGIDFRLVLAGTGRDWDRIAGIVRSRGLADVVELPGLIPYGEMPDFYRSLDLFLVPRGRAAVAMDTTPLKPLEALACGLPLLCSNLPALHELLKERADVRFTEPDAASIEAGLRRFADAPWGGGGGIDARAWSTEVLRYEAVYEAALKHGPPDGRGRRAAVGAGLGVARSAKRGLHAAKRVAVRGLGDRGLLRAAGVAPLKTHAVVCGFPRTGSTLLQVMVEACVSGVDTYPGEVAALHAARFEPRTRPVLFTKRPDDVLDLDAIDAWYAKRPGDVRLVLTVRDPRDVLTSVHRAYTADRGYYVTPERFHATWRAFRAARERGDALVLRYEDFVNDPDAAQRRLDGLIGWSTDAPFSQFHARAQTREQDSMTEGALGGLRPVETAGVARWQKPVHASRITELLGSMPELAEACVDLGYETDDAWTAAFSAPAGGDA